MLIFKKSIFLVVLFIGNFAYSEDLFDNNFARDYKSNSVIYSDSTVGGYPIFQGGRQWRVISGKTNSNNVNLKLANIQLISSIENNYFAEMTLMVNLEQQNSFFTSDICNGLHLFKLNKGGGKYDNCLTIDPLVVKVGGSNINTLHINVRNSQQGARIYDLNLLFNFLYLGFPQTEISDWTEEGISRDIIKKKFLDQIIEWSKKLQDGVNKAIAYSKPQDAFAGVPPIGDLLQLNGAIASDPFKAVESRIKNIATVSPNEEAVPVIGKTLLQRLSELKELLDKNLITKDQYEKRSSEIIQQF